MAQWRKQHICVGGRKLSSTLLKHADDQTLMALQAVASAMDSAGWRERSFADWGVVAAPNFFGRSSIAQTVERFRAEGAWGVAPILIPNYSLHAVSGTISQVLAMHGPNFGIGSGPNAAPEAFQLAPALLVDGTLPGLWLLLTGHECEWIPAPGEIIPAPQSFAVALALVADDSAESGRGLSILLESNCGDATHPELDVVTLCDAMQTSSECRKWRISASHSLELDAEARS